MKNYEVLVQTIKEYNYLVYVIYFVIKFKIKFILCILIENLFYIDKNKRLIHS